MMHGQKNINLLLTTVYCFIHTKYTTLQLSYELHKLLWVLGDLTGICNTVSRGNKDRNEGFKNELYEKSLFADCFNVHAVIIINLYMLAQHFTKHTDVSHVNTFTAIVDFSRFNNSCLKSPASTLVDLTFQSRPLRSFSLNQLCNLSL